MRPALPSLDRRLVGAAGALAAALLACPPAALADDARAVEHWPVVADAYLGTLRGGLDLGMLTGYFAIERLVRVDGIDVARTLLVVEDVGRLTRGTLPSVQVLGNLANLIQIGPATAARQASEAAEAAARTAQGIAAAAEATARQAAQLATPAGPGGGTGSSAGIGNSAVNSSANFGSASMTQFGNAIDQAVGVATGETGAPPAPAPVATRAPAVAATPVAATPAATAAPQAPLPTIPATVTLTIPVGNAGQVIVVSNIPNAAPLATAIQNSVAATRIEAQTRISASLDNSLAALRSGALAAAIREQAIQSTR